MEGLPTWSSDNAWTCDMLMELVLSCLLSMEAYRRWEGGEVGVGNGLETGDSMEIRAGPL